MKFPKKSLYLLATVVTAAASGIIDNDLDKVDVTTTSSYEIVQHLRGVVDVKEKGGIAITPLNPSGKLRALHSDDEEFWIRQRMAKRGKRSKRDCSSDDDDDVCSIHTFVGTYFYAKGCNGMSFVVDISCDGHEKHCSYYEESVSVMLSISHSYLYQTSPPTNHITCLCYHLYHISSPYIINNLTTSAKWGVCLRELHG